jgi:hypothetical protein
LSNPLLHIHGSGPVHGILTYQSSSRSELQGITAIGIIVRLFMEYHSYTAPACAVCDNQGVVSKCSKKNHPSLRTHRAANIDLYLTQKDTLYTHPLSLSWIRGHADKRPWETIHDFKDQQLSRDKIYNIWCDRVAQRQWSNGDYSICDPDLLPSENVGRCTLLFLLPTNSLDL